MKPFRRTYRNGSWHVHKIFLPYFHKLLRTAYESKL